METGADKLVELVNERKKVGLQEAAKILGTTPQIVEGWAESMSDAGLIQIDYGLGGVTLKAVPEDLRKRKEQELVGERKELEKRVVGAQQKAAQVERRVTYTATDLARLEKTISERGKEAERILYELRTLFKEGEGFLRTMERTKGGAEQRQRTLRGKFASLERSLHASERRLVALLGEFETLDRTVEDVFKHAHADEAEVHGLEEMIEEVERDMNRLDKQVGVLRSRGRALKPGIIEKLRLSLLRTRQKAETVQERKKEVAMAHEKAKQRARAAHGQIQRAKRRL